MGSHAFRAFGNGPIAIRHGADGRADSSCFADEVVIDFPSVASAVDRIRKAFLAEERGAPLMTAVQLSRREALEGAMVPLEVPVPCTCHECGGRGEMWAEPCLRCHGSGTELRRHQLHVAVPAGVVDGARFNFIVTSRHDPPTRIELHVLVA